MRELCQKIVRSCSFESFIIGLILINAMIIALETLPNVVAQYNNWLHLGNQVILFLFVIEMIIKMIALSPQSWRYFQSGWNCFDFFIIAICLLPLNNQFATLARIVRLLRVIRLVSVFPELRLIVDTLIRTIPSMMHIAILLSLVFFVYGVAGYHLFHQIDPVHWRSLPIAWLTLFRIVTLEDWTDVMYAAMEAEPLAWIYFVSFVVFGTFVVINLFIAVVLNNLEKAKQEKLEELIAPPSKAELIAELKTTQETLARLKKHLEGK